MDMKRVIHCLETSISRLQCRVRQTFYNGRYAQCMTHHVDIATVCLTEEIEAALRGEEVEVRTRPRLELLGLTWVCI